MALLADRVSDFSPNHLSRRKERGKRALIIAGSIEPGAIALRMRHERLRLEREIDKLWTKDPDERLDPESGQLLHSLFSDKQRIIDTTLRLARIPQAPQGSKANDKRQTIDVTEPLESPVSTPPTS